MLQQSAMDFTVAVSITIRTVMAVQEENKFGSLNLSYFNNSNSCCSSRYRI